ncbi:MAG: paraquat-inducible protein A [Litoreibacter sp.]
METVSDNSREMLDQLIVCPKCDAVYKTDQLNHGERAVCARCHAVLITPRKHAGMQIIVLALAILILILSAGTLPFLSIEAVGVRRSASILDAALAFRGGFLFIVAVGTAMLILLIPLIRVMLVLYVLVPIVFDRPPARHAIGAFSLFEKLRPWSMAEIFALGCAVALVKVADLAQIEFGPAFWFFSILVVLVVMHDNFMCRWSIWKSLKPQQQS